MVLLVAGYLRTLRYLPLTGALIGGVTARIWLTGGTSGEFVSGAHGVVRRSPPGAAGALPARWLRAPAIEGGVLPGHLRGRVRRVGRTWSGQGHRRRCQHVEVFGIAGVEHSSGGNLDPLSHRRLAASPL